MLTEIDRVNYECAAKALEDHELFVDMHELYGEDVAMVAYRAFKATYPEPDEVAALLLRECIAKGEPLP